MTRHTRRRRFPYAILPAAALINALIFGMAAFLVRDRVAPPEEFADPIGVSLVRLEAPALPEREQVREPEEPSPQQPMDFVPDLAPPDFAAGGPADVAIAINLRGVTGISEKREFVFEQYELDQAPQPIVRVPPAYPFSARERGVEGAVQVKMLVTTEGTVGQVQILDARPAGVFEDAVRRCVPQWKFSPGKIQGKPVTAWVVTTVRFNLGQS